MNPKSRDWGTGKHIRGLVLVHSTTYILHYQVPGQEWNVIERNIRDRRRSGGPEQSDLKKLNVDQKEIEYQNGI